MIEMNCPHCGHHLRVRSKYAGKQGQCKHCEGIVDVPNTYIEEAREVGPEPVGDISTLSGEAPAGTALADLLADNVPEPVAPTVPMPPDAMDAPEIPRLESAPKPLGLRYWATAILVPPVALVMGLLMPAKHRQKKLAVRFPVLYMLVIAAAAYVVVNGVPELPSQNRVETAESETPGEPIAVSDRPSAVPAASLGNAYEDTGLPAYPGMTFKLGDLSENELAGLIEGTDSASLNTYVGNTVDEYQAVTAFFFEQLQADRWAVSDYGYGDAADGETYIIGTKGGHGIVFRAHSDASGTRVVITHGPIPGAR